jgi:hypothetical protein
LFSIAETLIKREDCRTIIFDGSEAWLYNFNGIPVFDIGERDIQNLAKEKKTDDMERYGLAENGLLFTQALRENKNILFRFKTRKPSKRGFFIQKVVNYLDAQQREERENTINHESKQFIAYFIEEAQDAFPSRASARLDSEEFFTVFNEGRNQKEAFFTSSQRLTDFKKTIRSKQNYCLGKINIEDKEGIKKLENHFNINLSNIPARNWFYEGKIFQSPEWKQSGKPHIVKLKPLFNDEPITYKPTLTQRVKSFIRKLVGSN